MTHQKYFDVIIIGGSYSGLAAAMALGRSLRSVLVIDYGKPCNRQTPFSHNFITHDGKAPGEIAAIAKMQVEAYETIKFLNDLVSSGTKSDTGFLIHTETGKTYEAKKLIFATGIKDIMPDIHGFDACWGISVLHCPYCHGYEVRNKKTGIIGNGDTGFELINLISNWTKDLTLYTNGNSTLTKEQYSKLENHSIPVIEKRIEKLDHIAGHIQNIIFDDGSTEKIEALYARPLFEQTCEVAENLGCEINDEGYYKADAMQRSTTNGVYVCGDNTSRMRTVANAVASGTTAGMMVNRELTFEEF